MRPLPSGRLCRLSLARCRSTRQCRRGARHLGRAGHRLHQVRSRRGEARRRRHLARLDRHANAFSLSSGNMDFKRELDFKVGNGIFRKNWVSAPSSTDVIGRARATVQLARLPELPSQGRPRPSASVLRRARQFRLDAGPPVGAACDRRREGAARSSQDELAARSHLWRPAPGLRHSGLRFGGQAEDRLQGAQGEARRRRDRELARADIIRSPTSIMVRPAPTS